jgi:hypothetical protein
LIKNLYLMILNMLILMIRKYILLLLVLNFQGRKKKVIGNIEETPRSYGIYS